VLSNAIVIDDNVSRKRLTTFIHTSFKAGSTALTGIREMDHLILLMLSPSDLLSVSQTCVYLKFVLQHDYFWKQYVEQTLPPTIIALKPPEESYREHYKLLRTTGPITAARAARPDAILYNQLVRHLGPPRNVQNIAARNGDITTLKLFPGMLSDVGMVLAAKHGHLNVFEHLHKVYGALRISDKTMVAAVEEGHLHILDWIDNNYALTVTQRMVNIAYIHHQRTILEWFSIKSNLTPSTIGR